MGLIKDNSLLGEIEGMVGGLVLAKYKPGVKIVRKTPVRTQPATEGELANQAGFRLALTWAKSIWRSLPELKAKYNAAARLKFGRGFDLAKSDFLRPPVVEEIDLTGYTGKAGETIRVRAVDVFELKGVEVKILSLSGAVLEQGDAVLDGETWVYSAKVEVPGGQTVAIEATAMDYPEHKTTKKVDHACGPRA